jgi:hypothetical protein
MFADIPLGAWLCILFSGLIVLGAFWQLHFEHRLQQDAELRRRTREAKGAVYGPVEPAVQCRHCGQRNCVHIDRLRLRAYCHICDLSWNIR